MGFCQISRREGRIERVPEGQEPPIELTLEDNQYVVSASLTPLHNSERVTVDWIWTVYVVSDLGRPAEKRNPLLAAVAARQFTVDFDHV